MRVRALRQSDVPALRAMHAADGFEYEFPDIAGPHCEAVLVVVNEADEPIAATIAEEIIQLSLLLAIVEPAVKLEAIRLLHVEMAAALRSRGWREANAFLPPRIAKRFGRRLMRTFGWATNWPSFCIWFGLD